MNGDHHGREAERATLLVRAMEEILGTHGTLLTARAVGMIATAGVAVYLLRRTGYRWPIAAGFAFTAVGLVTTATSPAGGLSAYAWLALAAGTCGIGMGVSTPAASSATLQLAPDQSAAVAGLRAMFPADRVDHRGFITAAIVARSADPGLAQAHLFVVSAAILLCSLPLIVLVPQPPGRLVVSRPGGRHPVPAIAVPRDSGYRV
jgi:MFS family permease